MSAADAADWGDDWDDADDGEHDIGDREVICTIVDLDGEQEALYGPDGALLWVAEWPWDGRGISTHKYRDAGCTAVRHRTVADDWDWPTDENYEPVWPETIDGIALEEVE